MAVVPWDTEIFGFPVAQHETGDPAAALADLAGYRQALARWARASAAELIAAAAPAAGLPCIRLLAEAGFQFVDFSLRAALRNLAHAPLPTTRLPLRQAEAADGKGLEQIAGTAFRAGRYHMDPRFPRTLANRRYRHWVRSALTQGDPLYVFGPPGQPRGFFHLVYRGDLADLRLIAVADHLQGGAYGLQLCAAALQRARAAGARRASARISASNTAVMNLYAALGFRFAEPEAIFHWHAPGAPHLLPGTAL